ncbi:MAG: PEP-CTERM sorting domain-containing protein, partial [Pirellula sp.]
MSPLRLCCSFAFGLVIGVSSLLGGNAKAGMLSFKSEATAMAGSSVGSTVFQTNTAVKFTGLFDSADTILQPGGAYAFTQFISLQIEIGNLGAFDATTPNAFAILSSNVGFVFNNPAFVDFPVLGMIDLASDAGYYGGFSSSTQPYTLDALSPNEFLGPLFTETSPDPFVITLAGGAGVGTFLFSDSDPVTASISAVPEPTSMAIFGLGSLLVVARRARR